MPHALHMRDTLLCNRVLHVIVIHIDIITNSSKIFLLENNLENNMIFNLFILLEENTI